MFLRVNAVGWGVKEHCLSRVSFFKTVTEKETVMMLKNMLRLKFTSAKDSPWIAQMILFYLGLYEPEPEGSTHSLHTELGEGPYFAWR